MTKTERKILGVCGRELSLAGFDDLAKEAYQKMDDFANVMALYVKNQVSCPPSLPDYLSQRSQNQYRLGSPSLPFWFSLSVLSDS